MKKLFLLGFLLISLHSVSQIHKKHDENKFKFYGTFDFRNTPNDFDIVEYYGIKLGMGNKSLRFGVSYHFLHQNLFSFLDDPKSYFNLPTFSYYKTEYHVF